jgi:hypothetical protein
MTVLEKPQAQNTVAVAQRLYHDCIDIGTLSRKDDQ